MHVVDAYVLYCNNNSIPPPSEKMIRILKSLNRFKPMSVTVANVRSVHRTRVAIRKLYRSENPTGHGDRFDSWCQEHGRPRPSQDMIDLMNENPTEAAQALRGDAEKPLVYRAFVTYKSMGGFRSV